MFKSRCFLFIIVDAPPKETRADLSIHSINYLKMKKINYFGTTNFSLCKDSDQFICTVSITLTFILTLK